MLCRLGVYGFRAALSAKRAQFYRGVPSGPFYGFNRPGATVLRGTIPLHKLHADLQLEWRRGASSHEQRGTAHSA